MILPEPFSVKLLFSIIGDPKGYSEVVYVVEGCNKEEGEKSKTSY